jgi:N-methylhydantoinase B
MGQTVSFTSKWPGRLRVSLLTDRTRVPAKGIYGGEPGKVGHVLLNGQPVSNPKSVVDMLEGDTLELALPGGGGYGKAK